MRTFIIADLEGVGGVVCADEKKISSQEYQRICSLQIREINAAIVGARDGGATKIIVRDFHGNMRNIDHAALQADVELITGSLTSQIGAEFGVLAEPCDIVFLLGFHSPIGTGYGISLGQMNQVMSIEINGRTYGEVGVLAAVAGHYSIPVGLVTGDETLIDTVHELLPGTKTVTTKYSYSPMAARCIHPQQIYQDIRNAAKEAIMRADEIPPYVIDPWIPGEEPIRLTASFSRSTLCDIAEWIPGVERVDSHRISLVAVNMLETYQIIYLLSRLDAIEKSLE